MNLSAKMIDRRTSTPKGNHSYGPFFLEYSLLAEYNLLQKQKMPGVYVIPSYTSPLCKQISSTDSKVYVVSLALLLLLQVGTELFLCARVSSRKVFSDSRCSYQTIIQMETVR